MGILCFVRVFVLREFLFHASFCFMRVVRSCFQVFSVQEFWFLLFRLHVAQIHWAMMLAAKVLVASVVFAPCVVHVALELKQKDGNLIHNTQTMYPCTPIILFVFFVFRGFAFDVEICDQV